MTPPVWVMTGFTYEAFTSNRFTVKLGPDRVIGQLTGAPQTIMHGVKPTVNNAEPPGYVRLNVSLQKMDDFENVPLAERGLGAVCGGFIVSLIDYTSAYIHIQKTTPREREWGSVDGIGGYFFLGGFRDAQYKHYLMVVVLMVVVCFDRTNVAPVSGFWRNGHVMIGPDIQCDKTDWGVNVSSNPDIATYSLVLEKEKRTVVLKAESLPNSTVVLNAEFPELALDDGVTKTAEPEVLFSEVFTNGSSATVKDNFNMKTTLVDTHAFVFEEGLAVDWSAGWTAKVPLLPRAQTTTMVEVSFRAHRACATSNTRTVDRSAEITLPPMVRCKATAQYMKTVLTVNAVLTVQKTYTDGAVEIHKVPCKYTRVSCETAEIEVESVPVET